MTLIGADAYFSNDVDSDGLTTRYIGSKYPSNLSNEAEQLTIFSNGIYTCIVGLLATIERINMVSGGDGLLPKLTQTLVSSLTTINGNGGNMTIDHGSNLDRLNHSSLNQQLQQLFTYQDIIYCALCLNNDLLDGKTTKDITGRRVVVLVMSRESPMVVQRSMLSLRLVYSKAVQVFPTAGNNATIGGNNEINNLEVTGTFTVTTGTNFTSLCLATSTLAVTFKSLVVEFAAIQTTAPHRQQSYIQWN